MKVLKGTLTFVLGMIIGIILFVVAIGGTVAILATQVKVGDLQQSVTGTEIVAPDSELYNKTVLEAVKGVIDDVQNFDKLTLKTLYEHYGIKLLNGISGIDFTTKDFYTVPITDLVNDLSIIVNSFTLNDVSKIAGVDFASYNLPVLTDNLNNNLSTAMDNILGSLNGDLSIRAIKDSFGIDLGVEDNALLKQLQDVVLSEFGNVINFLRVNALLNADTDIFIPTTFDRYIAADRYVQYSTEPADGLLFETSTVGGEDSDGDGVADCLKEITTLFVKKTVTVDGQETTKYVVDNKALSKENVNSADIYMHVIYEKVPASAAPDAQQYAIGYANRVGKIINGGAGYDFTALQTGVYPLSDFDNIDDDIWSVTDDVITSDSEMQIVSGLTSRHTYKRVHIGTSTALLQTIAHLTVNELQNADNLLANLTINDVIEITDDTARIIKSLAARNCKILELGTVANELTLDEMIDIVRYSYEESPTGKYVYISDGNYYTLYNPAQHAGQQRYERLSDDGAASSALLQRFAGATLGSFSSSFDQLMLADVLEIDADVYAAVDIDYIDSHPSERYFYYDATNSVYRVADAQYISSNQNVTFYRIAQSGDSASFMKKLAYVKIDAMSDAMEVIIDDMMLSEFIEVYSEYAVTLGEFDNTFDENGSYFVEFDKNDNYTDNGTKYVYVYDIYGEYTKANFRPVTIDQNVNESTIYYTYKPYSTLGATPKEVMENSVAYTAKGNLYYLDGKTNEYTRNMVLCTYMLTHTQYTMVGTTPVPTLSGKYHDQIFYREAVSGKTDADVDNRTVFKGTVYSYTGTDPAYGIVIRDNFRGYIPHIENDPAFADKPLYTFEKSATGEPTFIVDRNDVQKLADVLSGHDFKSMGAYTEPDTGVTHEDGIYFARRECENIYVFAQNGEFVFVDGQYVPYDANIHSDELQRFDRKIGYIAMLNEVSYTSGTTRVTELDIAPVTFIREKSSPVLRMLARGTIGEMSNIINNATVGDLIEAEPGSLFDNELIKQAKLSELGSVFGDVLTDMTIGDLIIWSHVTDVNEYVRLALEDVTLQRLISSMVLDETTHEIKIDMLKLYGYNKSSNDQTV